MTPRTEEAKERAAIAAVIQWLLSHPKTLLVLVTVLTGTTVFRESERILNPAKAAAISPDDKVRLIVKEELAPVVTAQLEGNKRLGNIESALMMRGLRAGLAPDVVVP